MNIEKKERLRITSETLTRKRLADEILHDGVLDARFTHDDESGAFVPLEIDIDYLTSGKNWFPVVRLNGLIVGFALLMPSPFKNYLSLETIAIDKTLRGLRRSKSVEEQGMRLSETLVKEIVLFLKARHMSLTVPLFTSQGEERVRHQLIVECRSKKVPLMMPGYGTLSTYRPKNPGN